jgi:hypothetical protein
MAALVNKICKLCGVKTWEEDGFVQCDCMMVDKNAWEHGVAETPKEWINMPPMKIFRSPKIRFVNNGDVSIRIRQDNHTYDDLVILDMRLEDKGFGWFIEQVLMEDESQTKVLYFPTLKDAVEDAIDYIKVGNSVEWENQIPLIEKFLEINHE